MKEKKTPLLKSQGDGGKRPRTPEQKTPHMIQSIPIFDAMKRIGFRFVGTGGGRLYFHRVTAAGIEHREFKNWADVESFARENTKGN